MVDTVAVAVAAVAAVVVVELKYSVSWSSSACLPFSLRAKIVRLLFFHLNSVCFGDVYS